MSTVALSGNDTLILQSRVFTDQADGDVGVLSFPNGLMEVKKGKNDNSIFAFNNQGKVADLKLRLIRGSDDDKFLQAQLTAMENNPPGFTLLQGQFIKSLGDGAGNITNDTYSLQNGVFVKRVEAKENTDGDTNQSVAEYDLKFANAARIIA